eukprot:1940874-Lingulodinium_polyedra.AAC.1
MSFFVPPPGRPPPDQVPGPPGPPPFPQARQERRARRRGRFRNASRDDGDQTHIVGRHCARAMQ